MFDIWHEQLDRYAHPEKNYHGYVPLDGTDAKANAHHAHERNVDKLVFQMILLGQPEGGVELTTDNIDRWKAALNSGEADKMKDLPQKILIDVLQFLDLQAKDKQIERHNLQA